jgi:protein ImuB
MHAPGMAARLLACAQDFSPQVEQADADTVILNIDGLGHLFGAVHEIANAMAGRAGVPVNVAVASNPDAAFHAACGFSGISIIPEGDEAKFLATLPVSLLAPPEEIAETLARWGIRTFRDLAALPDIGIAARLGEEGVRLQKLARGEGDRPLTLLAATQRFEEEMELEYPLELLEPLMFVLSRLLGDVCTRLEAHALAAIELRLRLQLENTGEHALAIRLPVPMRSSRVFLKLLELDLEKHPPAAPIVRVRIAAEPAKPRFTQNGLFIPLAPEPEKLELTLARIAALVGEKNVGSPGLVDTHWPGAFRMSGTGILACALSKKEKTHRQVPIGHPLCHLAFRAFRPPLAAKMQAGFLSAQGIRGKIVQQAGPWRTSGDWWAVDTWARDEWDIELADGGLYRIYSDAHTGRWFIEGSYD